MKSVEELQKLLNAANAIDKAKAKYKDLMSQSNCDKKGFGFNLDSRFAACDALSISVDSWKGFYGDSGCSTILDLDKEIFNTHLLKVLKVHFWKLLDETEVSIRKEAAAHKEKAEKELNAQLETIKSL